MMGTSRLCRGRVFLRDLGLDMASGGIVLLSCYAPIAIALRVWASVASGHVVAAPRSTMLGVIDATVLSVLGGLVVAGMILIRGTSPRPSRPYRRKR